jgi:putative phage-type endonuclease
MEDERTSFFEKMSEEEYEDLEWSIYELLGEYMEDDDTILKIAKPSFHTEVVEDITHVLFQPLNDADICEDSDYDDLYSIVEDYLLLWFQMGICPERQTLYEMTGSEKDGITLQIDILRQKNENNPKQRTREWHEQRYQMMTASNLWQTLGSDAQKNRFIFDKCKPIEPTEENKWRSTEGSLHWGVKYEPLTAMVYEKKTGASVESLGCIQHPKYAFLGASPDGIVVNAESPLYGRLVEIKNIYNREMDGIPSEAYWVQIQSQLACCELEKCDFVETRFKEYPSEQDYLEESDPERWTGMIAVFVVRDDWRNTPVYKYMPLDIARDDRTHWLEELKMELEGTHILYNTIYWCLEDIKMSTVSYNELWFNCAVKKFKETWGIIEAERVSGYEHRSPKKRTVENASNKVCVIKLTESETIQIETECV